MGKTANSLTMRRSARVNVCCPVRISGLLRSNIPYVEDTQIVTLSKFGAKLRTTVPLQVGMQVTIQPLRSNNSGVFRVVWVGQAGTVRAGEAGVEYTQGVTHLLGISFPDLPGAAK
jgi:hypothetical protein